MTSAGSDSTGPPAVVFDHLASLTDERGLFEHAERSVVRREHGYCVDDAARALVVVCREPASTTRLRRMERCYAEFVLAGVGTDGRCRNRMDVDGRWLDHPDIGDWWGRAIWGLGVAAVQASTPGLRARCLVGLRLAAQQRSPNLRSMAFAALGAARLLTDRPDEVAAQALLRDAVDLIADRPAHPGWQWPEPRLAYGNAALAEALIAGGTVLGDREVLDRGLGLLDFLLDAETRGEHLSVAPVGGRGVNEGGPGFDQQPIEVASLADACASAFDVTGDRRWTDGINLAWRWFLGDNDCSTVMLDPATGAGFDGLIVGGRNLNQGAESTLAALSTAQHARRLHDTDPGGTYRDAAK